jgi:hypothetical protein
VPVSDPVPPPDPAAEEPLPGATPEPLELLPVVPLDVPPPDEVSPPDELPPPPLLVDELPDEQAASTATTGITKYANGTLAELVNRIATFPRL